MHVKVDCFLCGKVILYILFLLYPSCSNLDDVWVWKLHRNRPSIIYNSVPLLLLHSHIRYYRQDYFGSSHLPWKNPASRRNIPSLSAPSLDKKGSMGQKPPQCHSILVTLWPWLTRILEGCWFNLHSSFSNMHKAGSAGNVSLSPSSLQSFQLWALHRCFLFAAAMHQ